MKKEVVCSEEHIRVRKGISAIVFYKGERGTEYLLLRRKKNWKGWELLKGGRKTRESEDDALKREVKEETGESKIKVKKTKFLQEFQFQEEYAKDNKRWDAERNRVYAVQIFTKEIRIDRREHSGFKWVKKSDVLRLLTWPDQKQSFRKAMRKYL